MMKNVSVALEVPLSVHDVWQPHQSLRQNQL